MKNHLYIVAIVALFLTMLANTALVSADSEIYLYLPGYQPGYPTLDNWETYGSINVTVTNSIIITMNNALMRYKYEIVFNTTEGLYYYEFRSSTGYFSNCSGTLELGGLFINDNEAKLVVSCDQGKIILFFGNTTLIEETTTPFQSGYLEYYIDPVYEYTKNGGIAHMDQLIVRLTGYIGDFANTVDHQVSYNVSLLRSIKAKPYVRTNGTLTTDLGNWGSGGYFFLIYTWGDDLLFPSIQPQAMQTPSTAVQQTPSHLLLLLLIATIALVIAVVASRKPATSKSY